MNELSIESDWDCTQLGFDGGRARVVLPVKTVHRIHRIHGIVFEELKPTAKVTGAVYLKVILQIAHVHYVAWTLAGMHHLDISSSNILYWDDMGEKSGALLDWDLPTDKNSRRADFGRTSTIPFIALDFLRQPDSCVQHLYRHDLEAMFWILVWTVYPRGTFRSWESADYQECWKEKFNFLHKAPALPKARDDWRGVTVLFVYVIYPYFKKQEEERTDNFGDEVPVSSLAKPKRVFNEPSNEAAWTEFRGLFESSLPALNDEYPDLAEVVKAFLEFPPE